jgi:hypothetical protein
MADDPDAPRSTARRPTANRRPTGRLLGVLLRWVLLLAAVAIVIVFLVAQGQSVSTTYGRSPDTGTVPAEPATVAVPSVARLKAMVAADRVVRLPGSVAQWDPAAVATAIGGANVRILVLPPGLTDDQRLTLFDVDNATILVFGTFVEERVGLAAVPDDLPGWQDQLGRDDVTDLLVLAIKDVRSSGAHVTSSPDGPHPAWRDPTATELSTVATALRARGEYAAPGATLTTVAANDTTQAFGTGRALYVAFPAPPRATPAPAYAPALARLFPGVPIVVLYGDWITYAGPHAADFADLASDTFYGWYGNLLSRGVFRQDGVLHAYLRWVAGVRDGGLFDRPLPYRPYDPLRVALPVLPWLFAACVAGFLALSLRSALRPALAHSHRIAALRRSSAPARLAGLTALAVEVSGLTDAHSDPALARAIIKLAAARDSVHKGLSNRVATELLDEAQAELDAVGRAVGVAGYRPEQYLRGRLA